MVDPARGSGLSPTSPDATRLSLSVLGLSLDAERRSRLGIDLDSPARDGIDDSEVIKVEQRGDTEGERPYPLCLLCLTRPPTAVLLPCCHLNLCHLCAPLLIHRAGARPWSDPNASNTTAALPAPAPIYNLPVHLPPALSTSPSASSSSSSSSSDSIMTDVDAHPSDTLLTPIIATHEVPANDNLVIDTDTPLPPTRTPWHVTLARATRNNPKARRLSMGGYRHPEGPSWGKDPGAVADDNGNGCGEIALAGEMTGEAVLASKTIRDVQLSPVGGRPLTFPSLSTSDPDGQVKLDWRPPVHSSGRDPSMVYTVGSNNDHERQRGLARCLVCRTDVQGWLRVYTG